MLDLKNIDLEQLRKSPLAAGFDDVFDAIEKAQEYIIALDDKKDDIKINAVRAGCVIIPMIIKKVAYGTQVKDFSREDWKEIADKVYQNVILIPENQYSKFIFQCYSKYILESAKVFNKRIPAKNYEALVQIAHDIEKYGEFLENGTLSEVAYVDGCLWLSLEAMIKLNALTLASLRGEDAVRLADALSSFAFEYGRLVLYQKEQRILETYLEKQRILDENLEREFREYLAELETQRNYFNSLLDDAFNPDLSVRLKNTSLLARTIGVPQEEILDSTEKIDAFFTE